MVIAWTAIGVTSALATFTLTTTKCEGEVVPTLCWAATAEGKELFELSGSEAVTVKGGASVFTVPTLGIEWLSTSVVGVGTEAVQTMPLSTGYKLRGKLEYLGITFDSPKGCKLQSGTTLLTEALIGVPNLTSTELTVEPEAPGGSIFIFTVEDNGSKECPAILIGTNKLKGSATGTIVNSATDLVSHRVEFKAKPCHLKFAGDEACVEGNLEGELVGKDPWSGQDG